jgi:hypothetical protein
MYDVIEKWPTNRANLSGNFMEDEFNQKIVRIGEEYQRHIPMLFIRGNMIVTINVDQD